MDDELNLDELARQTVDECDPWRIYQLGHGLADKADLSEYPDEVRELGENFYEKIVAEALKRMPEADFNWLQVGTRFSWWAREYMIFGPLDDDVAFWDIMDVYDLIGFWVRLRKRVFESNDIKGWGWFFLRVPGWYDEKNTKDALNNYYRKICWKYSDGAKYCKQEMSKVMQQDE